MMQGMCVGRVRFVFLSVKFCRKNRVLTTLVACLTMGGLPYLRPNLYRTVRVVLSDGSTFRVPTAVRMVGKVLQLERDPTNHPVYQVCHAALAHIRKRALTAVRLRTPPQGLGDQANLTTRREEARLARLRERAKVKVFEG